MVGKFSNGTFNEPERRRAIVSDAPASNFQRNGVAYGGKKLAKMRGKSDKKLQKGYKTVTKVYKMVIDCEIFNNGGGVVQVAQFREKNFLLIYAIFYLTIFRIYDIMEVWAAPGVEEALKARMSFITRATC